MARPFPNEIPPQHQDIQPGTTSNMNPRPLDHMEHYVGSGKLNNKVAIVTGGDSGIGRAVAIAFAKEGASVVIVYLNETHDAQETASYINKAGAQAILMAGDVGSKSFCMEVTNTTMKHFGKIDILVNNAGEQHPQHDIEDISEEQLIKTFRTNIFSFFFMTQAVLPHLKTSGNVINTASITAYRGHELLIDYSATKGAIVSFTRSLAISLAKKEIRVNAIAPGPIWTPLITSTFPPEKVSNFGKNTLMGRPGQPDELAPAYVYLASDDSSYVTGQTLHVNGGALTNS